MRDGLHLDLAALLADPASVPPDEIPAAIGELERAKAVLWARLTTPTHPTTGSGEDRLLTVEQAADRLSTSPDWLRRHGKELPFYVQLSEGQIRFSSVGIDRYIALRAGKVLSAC